MTIKRTRWRPDTCFCIVDYEWDDEDQSQIPSLTAVHIDLCAEHLELKNCRLQDQFESVRSHNQSAQTEV